MQRLTVSARRVRGLFAVADSSPALVLAQLSALKLQMPLLYLLLTINTATIAYTHAGIAPASLVFLPFAALCVVCAVRTYHWLRLDLTVVPPERRGPLLRRTQLLTMLLSPGILCWALGLAQYGDEITNLHVFFFLALTPIGCVFCLMHMRSAALVVAGAVSAPAVAYVLNRHGAVMSAIAINLLLVGAVMLFVLFIHYRDFVRLVGQKETLERMGEENLRLASTDMLTGLPNRRSFFPALDRAIARGHEAQPFLLAIVDLDGFKAINDTYGHVAGDSVLVEVARRLSDAVPESAVLARVGGDEFALIVPAEAAAWELDRISRDIVTAIKQPFLCAGSSVRMGTSIGFARSEVGVTAAEIIEHADYALYEAKAHSRGSWVMFAEEHRTRMRLRTAVEDSLRHADLLTELSLAYQPLFDLVEEKTIAFEALARWDSPVLGQVPPDRFIAIAERAGLIGEITAILLGKALAQLAHWPVDIALSFNLSMIDLTSAEAIDRICYMIEASGIDPGRVHFEVTETATLDDFEQAVAGLTRLKALGTRLSLDDFGTGYSSLAHLHRLPVDQLKIDQSFTRDLLQMDSARSIVASTLALARNLGLDCVVEGVETQAQVAVLRSYGCRFMQGYLFHQPMAAADVAPYLQSERHARVNAEIGGQAQTDRRRVAG